MLYLRSTELTHLITDSLYALTNISPFPPFPQPWKSLFYYLVLWVWLLKKIHTYVIPYSICLSLSGLFHLAHLSEYLESSPHFIFIFPVHILPYFLLSDVLKTTRLFCSIKFQTKKCQLSENWISYKIPLLFGILLTVVGKGCMYALWMFSSLGPDCPSVVFFWRLDHVFQW